MNDYFKTFQNITQSATQMTVDSSSIEIKQSAAKLKESVQPCFEELKQSANKLNELVKVSFAELEHAEDIWNSKPRIAQAPTLEILEQIGELTGCDIKINELGKQCKYQAIKQAKESWEKRIEKLRLKWFIAPKNHQPRKGVGRSDKEGFVKDITPEVTQQLIEVNIIAKQSLSLVYQEITTLKLESIQHCVALLDRQLQAKVSNRIDLVAKKLENRFSNIKNYIEGFNEFQLKQFENILGFSFFYNKKRYNERFYGFSNSVNHALYFLIIQERRDIYWEEVDRFKNNVSVKIEEEINSIFDNRIELVTKAIALAIAFYNDFLEKQARYQLETLEQREAEKAWIDRQRQELEQVQKGIEAILNQSVE